MARYVGKHARPSKLKYILSLLALVLIIGSLAWMFIEPTTLQIEYHTIVNSALSDEVKQLRILYVSDIHQSSMPFYTNGEDLVMQINAQKPDLVLLGGDYGMDYQGAMSFFTKMPRIRATYGVYAVFGECDRSCREEEFALLKATMIQAGVTPIVNDVVPVRIGNSNIYLAGVDDLIAGQARLDLVAGKCRSSDLTILLCHNPEIIPTALNTNGSDGRRNWFDLGLFGHTHGGQIPVISGLLGLQRSSTTYQRGWYNPNRIELLVSRGVGTCGLPIRFFSAPQMHLITIRSK